jgi:predicted membrane GTPase involved in stress response
MRDDEMLEVTPKALRLRKTLLLAHERKREKKHGPAVDVE